MAHWLTDKDAGDITQVSPLLATVEGRIASVIADGACDGEAVYREAAARQHDPPAEVIIPPRSSSVLTTEDADGQTVRVAAWQRQRNASGARIKWKFTMQKARQKLACTHPDGAKESKSR